MIVADASCVVDFTLQIDRVPLFLRALETGERLVAPALIDFEFLNVMRKHVLQKRTTLEVAKDAISIFEDLEIERFTGELMSDRIWQLRDNLTAYDASYVALAEMLDVPLFTGDKKISSGSGTIHQAKIMFCRPAT